MGWLLHAMELVFLPDGVLGEKSWFPLLDQGAWEGRFYLFSFFESLQLCLLIPPELGLSDFSWWWESERAKASP